MNQFLNKQKRLKNTARRNNCLLTAAIKGLENCIKLVDI